MAWLSRAEPVRSTILLVEDEQTFGDQLQARLSAAGYGVWLVSSEADATGAVESLAPELVIVDLTGAGTRGLVLCATLQERLPGVCVIVCSSATGTDDAVLAFKLGAADFVVKPVTVEELEIRVARALQFTSESRTARDQVRSTLGPLEIDAARRAALLDGTPLAITPTEFRLLALLVQRADEVVPVPDLARAAWGTYDVSMEASVRVHLRRLRAKLRAAAGHSPGLVVARGFGYRLTLTSPDC
jgi:DNA-binding response OmpR family regulator